MSRQGVRALDRCHGVNKYIQSPGDLFLFCCKALLLSLCNRSQSRITNIRCEKPAHICPAANCHSKLKPFKNTVQLLRHTALGRARAAARLVHDTARRRSTATCNTKTKVFQEKSGAHPRKVVSHVQSSGHIAVSDLRFLGHTGHATCFPHLSPNNFIVFSFGL
jgi:hypothetical protein